MTIAGCVRTLAATPTHRAQYNKAEPTIQSMPARGGRRKTAAAAASDHRSSAVDLGVGTDHRRSAGSPWRGDTWAWTY